MRHRGRSGWIEHAGAGAGGELRVLTRPDHPAMAAGSGQVESGHDAGIRCRAVDDGQPETDEGAWHASTGGRRPVSMTPARFSAARRPRPGRRPRLSHLWRNRHIALRARRSVLPAATPLSRPPHMWCGGEPVDDRLVNEAFSARVEVVATLDDAGFGGPRRAQGEFLHRIACR